MDIRDSRKWCIWVVGQGPLRSAYESLCQELRIEDRVRFLGVRDDVSSLYSAADGFVMSSEYEGLSAALLEASACGLPSVVTDVGGNADVVLNGVSGFVAPARDSCALACAMRMVMEMPIEKRAALSAAARMRAVQNFSLDSVITHWRELYRTPPSRLGSGSSSARSPAAPAQDPVPDYSRRTRGSTSPLTGPDCQFTFESATDSCHRRNRVPYRGSNKGRSAGPCLASLTPTDFAPARYTRARGDCPFDSAENKTKLVHAHTSKAGLLGRIASRMTRTPVVFTAHTWSYADGCPRLQQAIGLPLERLASRMGGPTLAVSLANSQMALKRSVVQPAHLFTVWNGIPDEPDRAVPGSHGAVTFTMVARFARQKDHATLLKAFAGMPPNCQLMLVGDGPTRPAMEELSIALGIHDRVTFAGDRSDTKEILSRSDVFVLSTNWEGLPLSILEAMRAGLPVISTSVGGCHEAVTDQVTGFLTRAADVPHLQECMQKLVSSSELIQSMGRAGRQRYEKDFRMETMMKRVLCVYDAVASVGMELGTSER